MNVSLLDHLPEIHRETAAMLLRAAYADEFSAFLGTDNRSQNLLVSSLDEKHCITAVRDNELIGLLALQSSVGSFLKPSFRLAAAQYGFLRAVKKYFAIKMFDQKVQRGDLYIYGIGVSESARGQGIGTMLLDRLEEKARRENVKNIQLIVSNNNPRAHALYKRLGFKEEKRVSMWPFNKLFKLPFDEEIWMVKEIR